jgi:hypothetical protein
MYTQLLRSMLNLLYLLPIITFWHTITTEIKKHKPNTDVANNMVSAIHCVGYIVQYNYNYSYNFSMNYAIHVSIGYYIYDLIYLLRSIYATHTNHAIKSSARLPTIFAIHHIVGMYLLYDMLILENTGPLSQIYNLAEISNLMLYVSSHLYKEYPTHKNAISISEFIQLIWYSYFRIIQVSVVIYQQKSFFIEYSVTCNCCFIMLYAMSIAWTGKLVKKNIVNIASWNRNKASTTTND